MKRDPQPEGRVLLRDTERDRERLANVLGFGPAVEGALPRGSRSQPFGWDRRLADAIFYELLNP
jgi:hypothetical protein